MKEYPKILGSNNLPIGEECVCFEKLDGSNLRFEWNKKQGWYKFGTRNRLFDKNDSEYGESIAIFKQKYGEALEKIFKDKYSKFDSMIVYGEFVGPYSFAGKHDDLWLTYNKLIPEGATNNPKDVVLFDVNINKKGFILPFDFIRLFSHLHIPKIIYQGKLKEEIVMDARAGHPNLKEGIVIKGGFKQHELWMNKVKTAAYLEELKRVFGTGWESHWE